MSCDHQSVTVVLTPQGPHHSKEVCATCGKFIRWLPKPETLERNKQTMRNIEFLSDRKSLNDWERTFLDSIKTVAPKLSPKQLDKLEEVCKRHGG